jgi:hypothetical protein
MKFKAYLHWPKGHGTDFLRYVSDDTKANNLEYADRCEENLKRYEAEVMEYMAVQPRGSEAYIEALKELERINTSSEEIYNFRTAWRA